MLGLVMTIWHNKIWYMISKINFNIKVLFFKIIRNSETKISHTQKFVKCLCTINYYETGNPACSFIDERDEPLCISYHISQEIGFLCSLSCKLT